MQTETIPSGRTINLHLEAREFDWEFASGQSIRGFGFAGQVPGPLLEAEVGDTLVVELTNQLDQPTTIHWHGLRLPAPMDGTEAVQRAVGPGESFEYRFVLPDAATLWYHSHVNETEQVERGLYGALVVRGPDEPVVDREQVLIFDDLKLRPDGGVALFGDEHEHHAGREGDVRLVNGAQEPELEISGGQIERWRIVNAANSRYVRLSIGGRPFSIVGTDGGLIGEPREATEVLVTPGERVDLVVGPFEEGELLEVTALPYDRGKGESESERFATLRVGPAAPSQADVPRTLRAIEPLVESSAPSTRTIDMKALMHGGHHQRDEPVRVGDLQVWDLINETGQDHPFHLHGFFFQVVTEGGEPRSFSSWEDTVNVPSKGQVRIAWLPDDRPGEWMYHCHILEHHAMGMMAHFAVVS
ncbi:MAG TPA: multicopper oxidase family protein [Candidatus Acidoferrum sp.]|nr:multicopper oxidase family protein [Candidatus Acidoferrum sp.]